MAERRMFTQKIVDSDAFLDMPLSTQCLYFHLNMRAKDKGIIYNPKSIVRSIGCKDEDLEILFERGYIKKANNYIEIVHWYENNGIGETAKKRNSYKYRQWRKTVIERDEVCMICGSKENLEAHHKKNFSDYPLLRTDVDNGITLCRKCHRKLHKELRND